ncbi:MAG TPA: hypothetical protein VE988_22480 [Gemmataceae bacterium]|nr:hypothetical protein [Gemmataceae bacterium]
MPSQIVALTFVILCAGVLQQAGDPTKQPKKALAGWPGLFPIFNGYDLVFDDARLGGDKKRQTYRQTAVYHWTGGADRHLHVQIARDADFTKMFTEETMKNNMPKAQKIEIAKQDAWLIEYDQKLGKKEKMPTHAKLIVPLGDDHFLLITQVGLGPFPESIQTLAEKFDFQKIKKALENPPDTGTHRTVEAFRQLKKGMSYAEAATWIGTAEKDIGSGIHIMAYTLDDGSRVMLGFPDFNKLMYVKHEGKDGKVVDLVD